MNDYGILSDIKKLVHGYFLLKRASGRTTSLIENLKNGDIVIFSNRQESERVYGICLDRGIKIKCVISDPKKEKYIVFHGLGSNSNVFFDHTWIEEFFLNELNQTQQKLISLNERINNG